MRSYLPIAYADTDRDKFGGRIMSAALAPLYFTNSLTRRIVPFLQQGQIVISIPVNALTMSLTALSVRGFFLDDIPINCRTLDKLRSLFRLDKNP